MKFIYTSMLFIFFLIDTYSQEYFDFDMDILKIQETVEIWGIEHLYILNRNDRDPLMAENICPSFPLKRSGELKNFDLNITELKYNSQDSTLILKGQICGVEEPDFRPFKNVMIFVGTGFEIEQTTIYGTPKQVVGDHVFHGEPIGFKPCYKLYDCSSSFAKIEKEQPTLQKFDCNLKVKNGNNFLIFALDGYELKVFSLKEIINQAMI